MTVVGLAGLISTVATDPALAQAIDRARSGDTLSGCIVAPGSAQSVICAALTHPDHGGRPVLVITATTRDAQDLAGELRGLLDPAGVAEFPAWETLPHERLSPTLDTVGRRLAVLARLTHPAPDDPLAGPLQVVVAGVRALLQPIVKGIDDVEPVIARAGDEVGLENLVERLIGLGYQRTDLVTRRGEVAVRGGIVDVFPPIEDHPVRVEFFGEHVEEVRSFGVADQRSLEILQRGLRAQACRELLLTAKVKQRAARLASEHPELDDILLPLSQGIHVEGMESLAPLLADGMHTLLDLVSDDRMIIVCDPERVRGRAGDLAATSEEFLAASWHSAAVGGNAPIDLSGASYRSVEEMHSLATARDLAWWEVAQFGRRCDNTWDNTWVTDINPVPGYRGDVDGALSMIAHRVAAGDRVVVMTAGHGPAKRISEQLAERDIAARLQNGPDGTLARHVVHVVTGPLRHGFDARSAQLLVITETDLVGTSGPADRDTTPMPSRRRRGVDPLQLSPGDHVVHEQHGVGCFVELTTRTVAGATREYLVLEYAAGKRGQPADRLYVPTDQLDQVTRYVGSESPSVHRLGGADWRNTKSRARAAVREIADELVRLYAARQRAVGHAFGPDTPWQRELEDAFPYVETPDQLACIDEVKADMEKSIPMDRIICGDVGYGKTEIAVRAAFKAVQDGCQVAVLVPTTLLVRQHQQTFAERFAPFPINVVALSRFQSDAQSRAALEGIHDGTVDVVIATHRLLSPKTRFKNLGLVIVDEEQRFGVEHKEHLKALRTNVDVLTMSATPIPRTLEMAVTGIREMSTIDTPPEQRLPILTFVGPYDHNQIKAAVRRELLRDGQVFFVHNRVVSIDRTAAKLAELVPEARVAVAHGQLNERVLEQVIVDFWERRVDVLVCTTIVENGLDIPNANTLIVDRADMNGLSQLHQLRGRVGRGRERAYAYFLYPPEQPLTETAHQRLATIAQHTDLGSGMAVAMKDLEIRGAGNLLGGEQSGHIADVGFDLYVRLVGEALAEVKGEDTSGNIEVRVELPLDAHLPIEYVPDERLRLAAYKTIASATTDEQVTASVDELVDRFGPLPDAAVTLIQVARLRVAARAVGVTEIVYAGPRVRFAPVALAESRALRLTRLFPGSLIKPATRTILVPRPMTARVGGQPLVNDELLTWARDLIDSVLLDR